MINEKANRFVAIFLSLALVAPAPATFAAVVTPHTSMAGAARAIAPVPALSMPDPGTITLESFRQTLGNLQVQQHTAQPKLMSAVAHETQLQEYQAEAQSGLLEEKETGFDKVASPEQMPHIAQQVHHVERFFHEVRALARKIEDGTLAKEGKSAQEEFQKLENALNNAFDATLAGHSISRDAVVPGDITSRLSKRRALLPAAETQKVSFQVKNKISQALNRINPLAGADLAAEHHLLRYLEKFLIYLEQNKAMKLRNAEGEGFDPDEAIVSLAFNYLFECKPLLNNLPTHFLGWEILHAAQIGPRDDKWMLRRKNGIFAIDIRGTTPQLRSFGGDGLTAAISGSGRWKGQWWIPKFMRGDLFGIYYRILNPNNKRGGVHHGFAEAVELLWPDIIAQLQKYKDEIKGVRVAGHSRGASTAALLASKLAQHALTYNLAGYFFAPAHPLTRQGVHEWDRVWNLHPNMRAFFIINPEDLVVNMALAIRKFSDILVTITPKSKPLFLLLAVPGTLVYLAFRALLFTTWGLNLMKTLDYGTPTKGGIVLPQNHTIQGEQPNLSPLM